MKLARIFTLLLGTIAVAMPVLAAGPVALTEADGKVTVEIDGKLFCEYRYNNLDKPVVYPILAPGQVEMTRGYPFKKREGEATDHPHQQSMWFTHGDVNGVDFWTKGHGKIVQTELVSATGGEHGRLETKNEWRDRDGKVVCTDRRVLEFGETPHGRVIDWEITLIASHGPVEFGETKEGTMGIRTRAELRLKPVKKGGPSGHASNSEGGRDGDIWGKRAEWVHYWGQVDGQPVGIVAMDHPKNLRHPTGWHARDYGLVAANPFAGKAFGKENEPGDYKLAEGESLTLRYRFLFYRDGGEKDVAAAYRAYIK